MLPLKKLAMRFAIIHANSELSLPHRNLADPDTMNTNHNESPFGHVIYADTRAQAVADGVQVEVTKIAQGAGIRFPVFLTRAVFDAFIIVPQDVTGQDEAGRLSINWKGFESSPVFSGTRVVQSAPG